MSERTPGPSRKWNGAPETPWPRSTCAEPSDAPFVLYFLLTLLYGTVNSLTSPALPDLAAQAEPDLSSAQLGARAVRYVQRAPCSKRLAVIHTRYGLLS